MRRLEDRGRRTEKRIEIIGGRKEKGDENAPMKSATLVMDNEFHGVKMTRSARDEWMVYC